MSLIYVSLERLNHYYIGIIPNNQYSSLHFQNGITFLTVTSGLHHQNWEIFTRLLFFLCEEWVKLFQLNRTKKL
jgi:hypothetical protein